MTTKTDVLIIGGGIAGVSIARELSRYELDVMLIEKESDVGWGQTKASYAICHPGARWAHGTLAQRMMVESHRIWDQLVDDLDIELARIGELVLVFNEGELQYVHTLKKQGEQNGIKGLEMLDGSEVRRLEPHVNPAVLAALHMPTGGVFNPFEVVYAFFENARANGVKMLLATEVTGILPQKGGFIVETHGGEIRTKYVANAAGLYAEKIAQIECDTLVMTGRFRPDSSLIDSTPIEKDPSTLGPAVDPNLMTSVPNLFAAGNVLRGADMHDLCALEGRLAARSIIRNTQTTRPEKIRSVPVRAERPIRYVVPQRIMPMPKRLLSKFLPWPEIQLERTIIRPTLEAWSGEQRIWQGSFLKLIGHTRIPIPIEKFHWDRVDPGLGVTLRVTQRGKAANSKLPRRRESRKVCKDLIPAFAGMTEKEVSPLSTGPSRILAFWRLINMVPTYSIDEIFDLAKIETRFQKIFELAIPFLNTRHNLVHTFIVYQYALLLLEKEPGSRDVALPACILHDVGWSTIPEDKQLTAFGPNAKDVVLRRKHEVEGAAIADRILRHLGYTEALIPQILKIIDGHDTTTGARSYEDAITKDSDKLFRLSALGFRIDAERFQEDFPSRVKYLLEIMDTWFLTETGRELATHEVEMRSREIWEQRERSS